MPRGSQAKEATLCFKRRTLGRCARCLAPAHHHLASAYRDQIRCLSCNLSSHKERHCLLRQAAKAAPRKQVHPAAHPHQSASSPTAPGAKSWAAVVAATPSTAAPPSASVLPPPPPLAGSAIGAAATWPEVIATSYELDQDMKDWEETAAIAWVVSGNWKVEALTIDRAIRKNFWLSHRNISVCPHQPTHFLVKFERKEHCTKVLRHGLVKADDALVQFGPWRPLEHAFGRRRDSTMPAGLMDVSATLHPQQSLLVPTPVPPFDAAELRALLLEQAASLRAGLLQGLADAVKTLLAETEALRAWRERAAALLDATCALQLPPLPHQDSAGHVAPPCLVGDEPVNDRDGQDATLQDGGRLEDQAGLLANPSISYGSEAWPEVFDQGNTTANPPDVAAGDGALQLFLSTVTAPVQQPLACTPPARKKKNAQVPAASPRRSGWIAIKKKAHQLCDGAEAIQEIIARACGLLAPAATFDDASRAAY
ncbi:hypothetical protein ACQ4PT_052352 [Festuca glaucescens]